ncbi:MULTISPECIES: integration host factor subunit alpha [Acidithiobacillus]|uniref:integration host factor subunit alpha n=1 Tax=Acidithiobacillus TaxID=119977 RepID=UPI00094AC5C7|nr:MULTISPECIES: integration host factor subunit alpha [Acidithiobacillus]MDD5278794.1 integration host factor subunit alpha [Acidithiobacillus sp.]
MTITKKELTNYLVDMTGFTAKESQSMIETFFSSIKEALASGEDVKISGFGNFTLRDKPERPGRNPKTGEPKVIKARRVVTYRASKIVKDQIVTDQ